MSRWQVRGPHLGPRGVRPGEGHRDQPLGPQGVGAGHGLGSAAPGSTSGLRLTPKGSIGSPVSDSSPGDGASITREIVLSHVNGHLRFPLIVHCAKPGLNHPDSRSSGPDAASGESVLLLPWSFSNSSRGSLVSSDSLPDGGGVMNAGRDPGLAAAERFQFIQLTRRKSRRKRS